MSTAKQIPWTRFTTEAVVIVASILLAFAIDAWWQRRSELEQADSLAVRLHADFQASQAHVDAWLAGNQRIHRATAEFLEQIREAQLGQELSVSMDLIVAVIGAPTYTPTDAALRAASATGQIGLIEDEGLRNALAHWRQLLADTSEDELMIRDIVVHELVPKLSRDVRLGGVFDNKTLIDFFYGRLAPERHETVQLRVTSELEGTLAERQFYATFVVQGLEAIRDTQEEILQLLDATIDRQ